MTKRYSELCVLFPQQLQKGPPRKEELMQSKIKLHLTIQVSQDKEFLNYMVMFLILFQNSLKKFYIVISLLCSFWRMYVFIATLKMIYEAKNEHEKDAAFRIYPWHTNPKLNTILHKTIYSTRTNLSIF